MGTPDCALSVLEALAGADHEIAAVYSGAASSPVAALARARGIDLHTPARLKAAEERRRFAELDLDAAVVAAYGRLLPEDILTAPRFGCFNLHPSLLPRWRGAAPVERALMAGDAETGIAVMQMDAGLDTGDIVLSERMAIPPGMNAGALKARLFRQGGGMILRALEDCQNGRLKPIPQGEDGMTYAAPIEASETGINWREDSQSLARKVQALAPQPGAWTQSRNRGGAHERLRILAACSIAERSGAPGQVIDPSAPLVACGRGSLRLLVLQRPGRKPLPAEDFLRGAALPASLGGE